MEENRESDNNNNSTTTTTSQQRQQQQLGNNNNRTNNINHRHNSHDRPLLGHYIPLDVILALPAPTSSFSNNNNSSPTSQFRQLDARLNRGNQRLAALRHLFNAMHVDDDDSHGNNSTFTAIQHQLPNHRLPMGHTSDDVDQLFNPVPVDDEDDDSHGSMPGLTSDTESEDSADGLPDLDDEPQAQLG